MNDRNLCLIYFQHERLKIGWVDKCQYFIQNNSIIVSKMFLCIKNNINTKRFDTVRLIKIIKNVWGWGKFSIKKGKSLKVLTYYIMSLSKKEIIEYKQKTTS